MPAVSGTDEKEKIANEEDLQGYFMNRMSEYVRSKGREVIGWDELTNSSFLPDDAIILGWQGYGQAALKAAEKGHRFIMTPARIMYLIRYQGPQWFEPLTYFGNNTLKDVYDYEPVQKDWKPEYADLLMGVQACMWTSSVISRRMWIIWYSHAWRHWRKWHGHNRKRKTGLRSWKAWIRLMNISQPKG